MDELLDGISPALRGVPVCEALLRDRLSCACHTEGDERVDEFTEVRPEARKSKAFEHLVALSLSRLKCQVIPSST